MAIKRASPEGDIQRAVVDVLRARRVFFFSIPNERSSSPRNMARLKGLGLLPGAADLIIIHKGLMHCLEIKAPGGRQSPNQAAFECVCLLNSIPYEIVYSLDEALKVLGRWHILMGTTESKHK